MTQQERIAKFKSIMAPCFPYIIHPETVEELAELGFFTAPASIHHHGQYEGALFDHSLEVTKALVNLTEKLGLTWLRRESPLIVGMFHDLCKVDNYKRSAPPHGDASRGDEWEYNNAVLLPGHGEKSVIMVQQFFPLTLEEILCIRWHMGAFDSKENWNNYGRSVTEYPNVLYTHTADMIAARIIGV